MKIVLFGAPGVGKGTQAKVLSKILHIPHISTGDMLRSEIAKQTDLGKIVKLIIDGGNLVPDEMMTDIIKNVLFDKSAENGFLLDGFPRTVPQAEKLDDILLELGNGYPFFINIVVDDELIIQRLSARRMCNACGNIINLNYIKVLEKCPYCGSVDTFIKRKDDEVDVIKNRLKVFHNETSPILEYYSKKANIIEIDGTMPVEQVTGTIVKRLFE